MRPSLLLALAGLAPSVFADPTWPSNIDDLEEIMFQITSFRARKFADTVFPCDTEASGPGRLNAAEWLRTGFHDMSTASAFFGTGGLDGSLQFELGGSENKGPGLKTTLEFMSPFISPKSSLSDLVALGVYTSVRSCGGPAVPFRAGRIDATRRGSTGVPQPENSIGTFQQQFERMGFSNEEMIQVTACGHTLGGVHEEQFDDIVPIGSTPNGMAGMDGTVAAFDNRIVTEYLDGTTKNPLVVGPSIARKKDSDFKVFNSDNNVTMEAMAAPDAFRQVCKSVLQKMIDVVPPAVKLTDPIQPYQVKPVDMQLTLANGGSMLALKGYIRVRTTELAEDEIESVTITYKNRNGESTCGSSNCRITAEVQGVTQGFDDTFAWYPIEANIGAATGISSFVVTVNHVDGTREVFDNNGQQYPLSDDIILQMPQSCVRGSSGALTITAAVRNERATAGVSAVVSYKTPRTNSPIPRLDKATVQLTKGDCMGQYTFFKADHTIAGGLAYQAYIDVISGDMSDSFNKVVDLGGSCQAFANPATCAGGPSTSSPTPSASTSSAVGSSSAVSSASSVISSTPSTTAVSSTSAASTVISEEGSSSSTTVKSATESTSSPSTTAATPTTASSDAGAEPTLSHREVVGGYEFVSCWTEANGRRTLGGSSLWHAEMTLDMCEEHCKDYVYWGTEYGTECYCGNNLHSGTEEAPLEDCRMECAGDDTQYCGAASRLELYSTTVSQAAPTATLVHAPTVSSFEFVGCWTDAADRTLSHRALAGTDVNNDECADACKGYRYFGTENGMECWCGTSLAAESESAPLAECDLRCAGDSYNYCGAEYRLELYRDPNAASGEPEQPALAGDYVWYGCQTDSPAKRTLTGKSTADGIMTNDMCATFCEGFTYFGTEYGAECYCGNELPGDETEAEASDCKMPCGGRKVEYCGAGDRLSVYRISQDEEVLGI